jgi:hypothetical protein
VTLAISLPHEISMTATINRPRDLPSLDVCIPAPLFSANSHLFADCRNVMYIHRFAAVVLRRPVFLTAYTVCKGFKCTLSGLSRCFPNYFLFHKQALKVENTAAEIRSASGSPEVYKLHGCIRYRLANALALLVSLPIDRIQKPGTGGNHVELCPQRSLKC